MPRVAHGRSRAPRAHTTPFLTRAQAWGFSPVFSFRGPPPPGAGGSVKFLAVADMGQAEADGSMEETFYTASLNVTRCARGPSPGLLLPWRC